MKTILLRGALFLLAMCLFVFFHDARAQTTVEFSAGASRYHATDGIWFDSASGPFQNNITPQSWILSLRVPGWKASLVNLGDASNSAQWSAFERGDELSNPSLDRTPKFGGKGSGRIYGITLAKTAEKNFGNVTLGIEGGAFVYHTEWHEIFWRLSDPNTLYHDNTTHNNLTLYAGVSARYKAVFVEARHYYQIQDGLIGGKAEQVTVGVSIPF